MEINNSGGGDVERGSSGKCALLDYALHFPNSPGDSGGEKGRVESLRSGMRDIVDKVK